MQPLILALRKRFPQRSNVGYNPRVRGAEETPKPLSSPASQPDLSSPANQSDWMTKLRGLWRLARFKDYAMSVVFTTCLGVAAAGGGFGWKMVLVLLANWLAVGFAFMFNDAEDAPDDALTPEKALRNPVTNGSLSLFEGHVASYAVAALAVLAYLPLGWLPTVSGILCMAFGHLYSWRRVRLKAVPILDVLSHGLMLAALQMLAAFYTFSGTLNVALVGPLISMVCASFYGSPHGQLVGTESDAVVDELLAEFFDPGRVVHAVFLWPRAVGRDRVLERVPGRVRDLAVCQCDAPQSPPGHAFAVHQRFAVGRFNHDVQLVRRAVAGGDIPVKRTVKNQWFSRTPSQTAFFVYRAGRCSRQYRVFRQLERLEIRFIFQSCPKPASGLSIHALKTRE
jgi:UbiA prenyltransferase family